MRFSALSLDCFKATGVLYELLVNTTQSSQTLERLIPCDYFKHRQMIRSCPERTLKVLDKQIFAEIVFFFLENTGNYLNFKLHSHISLYRKSAGIKFLVLLKFFLNSPVSKELQSDYLHSPKQWLSVTTTL